LHHIQIQEKDKNHEDESFVLSRMSENLKKEILQSINREIGK
jgi:hypothetical protein